MSYIPNHLPIGSFDDVAVFLQKEKASDRGNRDFNFNFAGYSRQVIDEVRSAFLDYAISFLSGCSNYKDPDELIRDRLYKNPDYKSFNQEELYDEFELYFEWFFEENEYNNCELSEAGVKLAENIADFYEEKERFRSGIHRQLKVLSEKAFKYAGECFEKASEAIDLLPDDEGYIELSGAEKDKFLNLCLGDSAMANGLLKYAGCEDSVRQKILKCIDDANQLLVTLDSEVIDSIEIQMAFAKVVKDEYPDNQTTEEKSEVLKYGRELLNELINEAVYGAEFKFIDRIGEVEGAGQRRKG